MLYNMMGYNMIDGMMGWGFGLHGLLWFAIVLGLAVLIWLWVIKLWREVRKK